MMPYAHLSYATVCAMQSIMTILLHSKLISGTRRILFRVSTFSTRTRTDTDHASYQNSAMTLVQCANILMFYVRRPSGVKERR